MPCKRNQEDARASPATFNAFSVALEGARAGEYIEVEEKELSNYPLTILRLKKEDATLPTYPCLDLHVWPCHLT